MKKQIIIALAAATIFAGCSTVILVRALWQKNPVVVDGNEQDWVDRTFYLNEQDVSIGVQNDQKNFYLFLKVLNPGQMRAIRFSGLTIWLDPNGGNDKEYGIRIPGKPMRPGEMTGSDMVGMMPNEINEVEIFTKGKKEPLQIPVAQLKEIQFAASRTGDNLIFEFKFPLKENADNPFGWNAVSDELGVTLETGKMQRPNKEGAKPEFGESPVEGNRPMGMDGEGERAGGGRRGGHLGEIKQRDKSAELDFWFKVRLAELKK